MTHLRHVSWRELEELDMRPEQPLPNLTTKQKAKTLAKILFGKLEKRGFVGYIKNQKITLFSYKEAIYLFRIFGARLEWCEVCDEKTVTNLFGKGKFSERVIKLIWGGLNPIKAVKIAAFSQKCFQMGVSMGMAAEFGYGLGRDLQAELLDRFDGRKWLDPHFPQHTCWKVTPSTLKKLWMKCGRKRFLFWPVLEKVVKTAERVVDNTLRGAPIYMNGCHWNELFDMLIPPRRVIKKGKEDLWLAGKYFSFKNGYYIRRWRDLVAIATEPSGVRKHLLAIVAQKGGTQEVRTQNRELLESLPIENWEETLGKMKDSLLPKRVVIANTWETVFGRQPQIKNIFDLDVEIIKNLKPSWKVFMRLLKAYDVDVKAQETAHTIVAAAKCAIVFGNSAEEWVRGKPLHDAGIELPINGGKEVPAFLLRHKNKQNWQEAVKVAKSWNFVMTHGGNPAMDLNKLAAIAVSAIYEGAVNFSFAEECARHGVEQKDYAKLEARWLKGLEESKSESIPMVDFTIDGYRFRRLLKSDPRGIFLGCYTNCCQHPDGVGASCAWHGHKSPDGAFVTVEDPHGKIIAQSWVWRNKEVLCFDNIEALGIEGRIERLASLYKEAAKRFCQLGITIVVVGTGYDDGCVADWTKPFWGVETPRGVYTDACTQRLVASAHS